jgi:O-antigen/teichoic acid export membrane protein
MKRLSANILSIVGSDVGRRVLGFLAVAYLARTVGPSGFGLVNIGFAVLSYAMMVSGGGLPAYGARAVARGESPRLASAIAGIRLVVSAVVLLAVAAGAYFFIADRQAATVITVFCLSQFAGAFLLDWYFQGKEEMGIIGASRLISAAVYLLFIVMYVRSPGDIVWVAIAAVAGDVMASLVTVGRFQKETAGSFGLRFRGGVRLFRDAFPIGIGSIIAHVTVNLPTIVIGILLTNADAGIYSAAGKLVAFLLVFDRLLSTLLLPASSRYFAESPEKLSAMLSTALRWVVRISLPLCVGGTLLADRLIPLVYGGSYGASADVLRILLWFLLLTMLHTVFTAGLIASGEERRYSRVMMTSGACYLVTVVFCTWKYGVAGSAVAIVISELMTLYLMRRESQQFIAIRPDRASLAAAAAALGMGAALVFLPALPLAASIAAGAAVYALLLVLFKGIAWDEFSVFMRPTA